MSQQEHVLLGQQQQQQQQRFQNFVRDTITQLSDTLVDDLQVASCPPPLPPQFMYPILRNIASGPEMGFRAGLRPDSCQSLKLALRPAEGWPEGRF